MRCVIKGLLLAGMLSKDRDGQEQIGQNGKGTICSKDAPSEHGAQMEKTGENN